MTRLDARGRGMAVALAGLAGFVDALGFLHLKGVFVSFMSGNTTRLAVEGGAAGWSAAVIALFVAGVVLGALAGHRAGRRRKPVVLAIVAAALIAAAAAQVVGLDTLAIGGMALAMGAANNVFQRDGEVSVPVTYVTGTLVKFGQHLAAALVGGPRWGWLPYAAMWLGLAAGAAVGAWAYAMVGLGALWVAAGWAAVLALGAGWLVPAPVIWPAAGAGRPRL